MKFFSYESKFTQLLLKLCKGCCLGFLWLICCIPVFTAGAATTGLYYACFKVIREEDNGITRLFFKGFRDNFRQSTVLWLILLAVGALLGADGWVLYHLYSSDANGLGVLWTILLAFLIGAAIFYVIVSLYVFPLTASVENTSINMLKNSFLIGVHYLFCTILVFAVHFALVFVVVAVFTPLFLFGGGLCALLCSFLLEPVIRKCVTPAEEEQ